MRIDTIQDLIENLDLIKSRELTYYDGNWCCFKVDSDGCGSCDRDITLNNSLFTVLKLCGYLKPVGHTVSHRAVTQFEFRLLSLERLDNFILELIPLFKDKRFKSLTELLEFKGIRIWKDTQFDYGSHWGGDRWCNCIYIEKDNAQVGFPYNQYGRSKLLSKNDIYQTLIRYHRQLNNLSWLNYRDAYWYTDSEGNRKSTHYIVDDFWKAVKKMNFSDSNLDKLVEERKKLLCHG